MLRLTRKNLLANRLRFAMTAFAVVLAVSFVVASFVLTDGLRSSFDDLSSEIVGETDFEVRPASSDEAAEAFVERDELSESIIDDITAIDGVAAAAALVEAQDVIQPVNADGEAVTSNGPPLLGFGWVDDPALSRFTLIEGQAPDGPGQFTMDLDAAATNGFEVGQTYDVITPTGAVPMTLTGLVSFGEDNSTLGATLMQFDLDTLQSLIGAEGYHSVAVAVEPGADRSRVSADLATIPGVEVVDVASLEAEIRGDFNQGIDIIGTILLGFAGISLFVSVFIIYNTFAIVLGQRIRELALLRVVGADPRQLRRSILTEAAAVGTVASAVGLGVGLVLVIGLRAVLGAVGLTLPDSPLVLSTRTVVAAATVGIGATLVSAIIPARRAARVPPVVALRDGARIDAATGRRRLLIGVTTTAVGLMIGAWGLFGASTTASVIALLAIGAVATFVGVTLISPLAAGPVARLLGWPLRRLSRTPAHLAQENASRNPERTATTAAALMIGLALVAMVLVVGESVKAQLRSTLETSIQGEYLAGGEGEASFPPALADDLAALDVVDEVASFRYDGALLGDEVIDVVGTDLAAASAVLDLGITDGVATDPSVAHPLLISDEVAADRGFAVGDEVRLDFAGATDQALTVIGVYTDDIVADEGYILDLATWDGVGAAGTDTWYALSVIDGTPEAEAEAALATVSDTYPGVEIDTANAFVESMEATIDQALAAVNVLVALAVIIALIGIANTLALSVFERTRELGLLRAVGMSRRQLRRMVRIEAALVALFGAILGVTVGVGFGWASVAALPATVTSTLAIPAARILILVVVAGAAGVVAAWGPARRASRLDVLQAIDS